ncbi:LAETG motif-containing sortase-dependent surface protein [Streptomyces sp. TLI_146]|uniref:LAETG motif-containing sortase-dependent surface protein n=1 Tax=Streptomyces sp. TLI_146 TaxID=1938858 RepID=UPI000C70DFFF|nr:LAETG motif-containing sortase-dependent surface protein [Streptomyces sp. TLI_146]PKV86094.1 colicin import membrane protein [Streptomyces sp. TLI_146]
MNIRRALTTAVAAAVTAPVVILSAGPALADAQPAAQTQKQKKPTLAELEKAAAAAKKVYEDALAAETAARAALDALESPTDPLNAARTDTAKKAADATARQKVADKALSDAEFELQKLPAEATKDERDAARKKVDEARKDAEKAAADKAAADALAKKASDAWGDARVLAAQKIDAAQKEVAKALAAKEAADKALADAKKAAENPACDPGGLLVTAALTDLPSKITAGTSTDFSLRITNGTDKTLDRLRAFTYLWAADKSHHKIPGGLLHLQWSTATSQGWKDVDTLDRAGTVEDLRAGAHADMKLRLTLDAKTPAGQGFAFVSALRGEKACDGSKPPMKKYPFEILAAGGKPGPGRTSTPDTKPLGGTSTTPVNTAPTGQLAATGSSSATPRLALAGGAAVVAGAGAVLATRRRRTDG